MLKIAAVVLGVMLPVAAYATEAKIVVLYGHPKSTEEFDKYYKEKHAPMAPPPYYLVVDILFESLESLRATAATDEWKAIAADVPNFATGGATPFVAVVQPTK
jgi:hypothetical protein